jgi:predicted short-subunit dehydrogenase-like oxidoreductase (DUF2520 family)
MHVGIVGLGSVGQALARALAASTADSSSGDSLGVRLVAVSSRRPDAARALANELTGVTAVTIPALAAHVDLVVLAVGDRDVDERANHEAWRAGITLVHTSGALDLTPLDTAAARGARVGSFHPMVSLPSALTRPSADQAHRFAGAVAAIDGSASVRTQLDTLALALGMTTVVVPAEWRTRWHAAATLVGNASAALSVLAEGMLAELPAAAHVRRDALTGLLGSVARNLRQLPDSTAAHAVISGPIARGDLDTVSRHLQAFVSLNRDSAHLSRDAYRHAAALVLLATRDSLSPETRSALTTLLSSSTTP